MRLELFNLLLETLPMRPVLRRIDGLPLEDGVLGPEGVDFAPKAVVLGLDVFSFAHVQIVARCRGGLLSGLLFGRRCEGNTSLPATHRIAAGDDRCEGRPTGATRSASAGRRWDASAIACR